MEERGVPGWKSTEYFMAEHGVPILKSTEYLLALLLLVADGTIKWFTSFQLRIRRIERFKKHTLSGGRTGWCMESSE